MKKYTNIDDLFKAGAAGFEMEPSAGLFDKITALHLKEKRRKRMAVYIWSLAALLLLLIGVSGWLFLNDEELKDAFEQEQIIMDSLEHEEVETVAQQNIEENTTNINDQEIIQEVQLYRDKKNLLLDESNKLNNDKIESVFEKNEPKTNLVSKEEIDIRLADPYSFEFPVQITINEMPSRSIYEIARTSPGSIDPRSVQGMEKYLEKRSNLHFYTGIGATIAKAFYPDTEDQFTWSADLTVGLKIHNFYIESGVGYQQMNERGIYQIDFRSNDSIGYFNEVLSFEIDPQNPDEITYKTQQTTVYDSIDHYEHKTPLFEYTYLNIPLKIGYRFIQKDQFSLSAETGIIFSKMINKSIPDISLNNPDYELIAIINQTPERVEMNYQWQLSVRFDYRFVKSMSLVAQPVFTKYINSIYDVNSGYSNVKPYTMGVRFGIYYDF